MIDCSESWAAEPVAANSTENLITPASVYLSSIRSKILVLPSPREAASDWSPPYRIALRMASIISSCCVVNGYQNSSCEVIPQPLRVVGFQQRAPLRVFAGRDLNLFRRRPQFALALGVAVALGAAAGELVDLPQAFPQVGGQRFEFVDFGHASCGIRGGSPHPGGGKC